MRSPDFFRRKKVLKGAAEKFQRRPAPSDQKKFGRRRKKFQPPRSFLPPKIYAAAAIFLRLKKIYAAAAIFLRLKKIYAAAAKLSPPQKIFFSRPDHFFFERKEKGRRLAFRAVLPDIFSAAFDQ